MVRSSLVQLLILLFADIAGNLTDPMYQGVYNGSEKHPPDLNSVLERAWDQKVEKIMVTGGSLSDSQAALAFARTQGECPILDGHLSLKITVLPFSSVCF